MANTKLTTVKILTDVYSKFKKISFDSNITLQKLVNRSLNKYVENEGFRDEINNYEELQISGSQFQRMTRKNQDNGNTQLNGLRNDFNKKVDKLQFLGNTTRIYWNDRRRFRTI